jgi:hypothetical protein
VTSTAVSLPGWSPRAIGEIGGAASLLHSSDTVIGLRNRALALYQKPLIFAVSDPNSKAVQKWKPSVGVAPLTTKDTDQPALTLGFEIPDTGKPIEWGPTINLTSHQGHLLLDQSAHSGRAPQRMSASPVIPRAALSPDLCRGQRRTRRSR